MAFKQRVYESISEQYLRTLMEVQGGVQEKMQAAIITYLTTPELMTTRGGVTIVCDTYNVRDSNFHRQISKMIALQGKINRLADELEQARERGVTAMPLSYVIQDVK